ncbi:tail-specific protease [Hahella sp. CCB-MM4]|uniref:carboxy terminal-processing peptidase n=1 Tax=Hahella sp. (strain CCB-MM4) TaxID=1926491 RepID=UPI000B9BA998|nr:carboxy terminal-processing peptidase [Hahella sp. CCB-MM4]OZG70154.1 tail-specific protease [Hahella sp. CCB-MM4]
MSQISTAISPPQNGSLKFQLVFLFLIGVALSTVSAANLPSKTADGTLQQIALTELQPTPEQAKASRDIARQLQYAHYRSLKIDGSLSSVVLDNFIKYLDPQRVYFTQGDIDGFEQYRYRLDGAIKSGQLEPAFDIYNQFQERIAGRLTYVIETLDKGLDKLDFSKDETLQIDREKAKWPADEKELDVLWHKRIKNAVLNQRLSGKTDEDIAKSLRKRYESQLNRISQARSEDAFQAYMNVVTNVYDPHTQYFSPRNSENFNINMSLSLEGIGAVLQSDNEFTKVVRLVPAGPADKHGILQPADRIVGVGQGADGDIVDVIGWRLEEVVDLIRGPKKTVVRLEVIPAQASNDNETRVINIVRDRVDLEDQSAQKKILKVNRGGQDYTIGIIDIPTFYANFQAMQAGDPNYRSTTRDVYRLLSELKKENIDGLVIDLRNNGGGALQEAIQLTGLFIQEGPTVQVRTADNRVRVYDDPDDSTAYSGPLAVLVNRMSASASEIFAAAIQDYGRGVIIGDQTFGKGTVQSVRGLSHGQLKITEAKFYRVSGGSTQHKGVIPDILLPSAIDKKEVGEDALPEALPWDQIDPVAHRNYGEVAPLVEALNQHHQERMDKNVEYQALLKEIEFLKTSKMQTEISLNIETRKKELDAIRKEELDYVNLRRKARSEKTFASYDEYEKFQEEQAALPETNKELDFVVKESGEILVDVLTNEPKVATTEG